MVENIGLYNTILSRRSVRRYRPEPLTASGIEEVQAVISQVKPLVPTNSFQASIHTVAPGENLAEAMGAYGRIITPPHYIVPYIEGDDHPLTDLGCRVEQIFVHLTALGIGACFIGALGREEEIRRRFDLPPEARIAAFLIFGHPTKAVGGRAINRFMRMTTGATNKLPADRLFYNGSFDSTSSPPRDIAPLIEAARSAPSAVDAQPWRFLLHEDSLYVFVKRDNKKYGGGPRVDYRLYDGGICIGNIMLAMQSDGKEAKWHLLSGSEADLPDYPSELEPLAFIRLMSTNSNL